MIANSVYWKNEIKTIINKLSTINSKKFTNKKDLFLNSENAEETWSVFDNPTIRIYKKINNLAPDDYQELLSNN